MNVRPIYSWSTHIGKHSTAECVTVALIACVRWWPVVSLAPRRAAGPRIRGPESTTPRSDSCGRCGRSRCTCSNEGPSPHHDLRNYEHHRLHCCWDSHEQSGQTHCTCTNTTTHININITGFPNFHWQNIPRLFQGLEINGEKPRPSNSTYWPKSQILPTPLSFSALVWSDPLRIYGKALWFPKLESSRQPRVNIWWF